MKKLLFLGLLLVGLFMVVSCAPTDDGLTPEEQELFGEDESALTGQAASPSCSIRTVTSCSESGSLVTYTYRGRTSTSSDRCTTRAPFRGVDVGCPSPTTFQNCVTRCGDTEDCVTGRCIPRCGNGVVDSGENCATCAADVSCATGGTCQEGACVATPSPFCYYLDANGTQLPAGRTYGDVSVQAYYNVSNAYQGIRTETGTFTNFCRQNATAPYGEMRGYACGSSSPFTSGEGIQPRTNPDNQLGTSVIRSCWLRWGVEGCNPITNRCCQITSLEQSCEGTVQVNVTFSDCSPEPIRSESDCSNRQSSITREPFVCVSIINDTQTALCQDSCTPGEVVVTCSSSSSSYSQYHCASTGGIWLSDYGYSLSACPTGQTCQANGLCG